MLWSAGPPAQSPVELEGLLLPWLALELEMRMGPEVVSCIAVVGEDPRAL